MSNFLLWESAYAVRIRVRIRSAVRALAVFDLTASPRTHAAEMRGGSSQLEAFALLRFFPQLLNGGDHAERVRLSVCPCGPRPLQELYFTPVLWPDFSAEDFEKARAPLTRTFPRLVLA